MEDSRVIPYLKGLLPECESVIVFWFIRTEACSSEIQKSLFRESIMQKRKGRRKSLVTLVTGEFVTRKFRIHVK